MKTHRPIHRIESLEARIAPAFAAVELLSSGLLSNTWLQAVGGVVGPAGDVNGDGLDDLVISAEHDNYLLFGTTGRVSTPVDLTEIDGTTGFRIPQSNRTTAAGDINGDGFDDLLISGPTGGGASYVILGHAGAFRPSIDLLSLDGESGFAITSDNFQETFRRTVGAAGDVNGDGLADMLIGAPDAHSAYVIFGRAAGFSEGVNLSSLDATDGFKIESSVQFERLGEGVSSAGDVNNDGFDDLLLNTGTNSSYLIFGRAASFTTPLQVSTLDGTNGVRIEGSTSNSIDATGAGDFNGDGLDDLLIKNVFADSRVIFGKAEAFPALLRLSTLEASAGFRIVNSSGADNNPGRSAGDMNGDGLDDLIFSFSNSSYVVFGKAEGYAAPVDLFTLESTAGLRIADTTSNLTVSGAGDLNGDGFDDVIIGANDIQRGARVVFGRAFESIPGVGISIFLSTLDGNNGFQIRDLPAQEQTGDAVSDAGDVNGDGYHDIIVGAPSGAPDEAGAAYVVFGNRFGPVGNNLARLNGNGFKITGAADFDHAGFSVSGAGDVNDDGFDDLLIGAPGADVGGLDAGATYLIFGRATGFPATIDLSTLESSIGIRIEGANAGDGTGYSVSAAGDVNGDGCSDLLIGAPFADANGSDAGAAYVVFGSAGGFANPLRLSALTHSTGFKIAGEAAEDHFGRAVSAAGDVNGDGFADLLIGAPHTGVAGSATGASYIVFGRAAGFAATLQASALDGAAGFKILGEDSGDELGASVSAAGDLNGDGFADLGLGAPLADASGADSGAGYVVFGRAEPFTAPVNLATLTADRGFKVAGLAAGDHFGAAVSRGDLDADGFSDVIFGAPLEDAFGIDSGAAYVVLGRAAIGGAMLDPGSLDGTNGFKVPGNAAGERVGSSVSAGDFNGDAVADLALGAPAAKVSATSSGITFVLNGKAAANGLVIKASGKVATFTDVDGDRVKITIDRGTLTPENFLLTREASGGATLRALSLPPSSSSANLTITAKPGPTGGDGYVNIGVLSTGFLQSAQIDGDVARIGGSDFGYSSFIRTLNVHSIGLSGLSTQAPGGASLTSFLGVGSLHVQTDIQDATLNLYFSSSIHVGGDLEGSRLLLNGNGYVGNRFTGDVLKSLDVRGSVSHSQILAGTNPGFNFAVRIGTVTVGGNWIASDLVARVQANDGLFGNEDDTLTPTTELDPPILSRIASVIIKGQVLGSSESGDHFGITAQRLGKVTVGRFSLPLMAGADSLPIGATGDFLVRDFI